MARKLGTRPHHSSVVKKVLRDEDEPYWKRFSNRGGGSAGPFEPDPRLKKVEESTTPTPTWYTDVHTTPVRKLLSRYGTTITKGLTDFQVLRNRHKYGANHEHTTSDSLATNMLLWNLLKSLVLGLNSLIWLCLIFSITIFSIRWLYFNEKPIEHLIFASFLLLSIILTTISYHYQTIRTNKLLTTGAQSQQKHTLVRRNGRFVEIPNTELVVGDLVQLSYGDVIPADVRIIEAHEFYVDNSGLTGEGDPKRRRSVCTDINPMETKNMAFYSTHALEGYAKGVVVGVGGNTVMGKVVGVVADVNVKAKSPLQKELDGLVLLLICQSLFFGSLFFCVSILLGSSADWDSALVYLMVVVVANVPEGLALTCTVLLGLISKKLRRNYVVVKNLHSIETLGSVSVVVTDKTGTVTQNRMSVSHLYFDDRVAEADTSEFLGGGGVREGWKVTDPGFQALARVARLCSRARFKGHEMDKPVWRREVQGDATEAALLRFMESVLGSVSKYRRKYKKVFELPFNSRRKIQAFVYEVRGGERSSGSSPQHYVVVKGAPEKVFELCVSILVKDKVFGVDETWKRKFEGVLERLGGMGDRVIGLADGLLCKDKFNESYDYEKSVDSKLLLLPEMLTGGLRFVGLVSLIDPPRAVVPGAVEKLRKMGVKVVMVTGDHSSTSVAIARGTGIFRGVNCSSSSGNDVVVDMETIERVVTGKELVGMETSELDRLVEGPGNMVFARTTPEQKYKVVEALQRVGHVVAYVGDGVNDSPGVKVSNVGVVMGGTGSSVSVEVADVVVLDDNFGSVVGGLEEGRRGVVCCGKLLRYTMVDNIAQMYVAGLGVVLRVPGVVGGMGMLLTVLGTDLVPAVSLCYEKHSDCHGDDDVGRVRRRRLITSSLLAHIYTQVAVFEVAAGFFAYFCSMAVFGFTPGRLISVKGVWDNVRVNDLEDSFYGQEWSYVGRKRLERHCQSVFFVSVVVMQVANVLICKGGGGGESLRSVFWSNWRMAVAIVIELALAVCLIYVPRISVVTGLFPLSFIEWMYAVPFAILLIVVDEFRRFCVRGGWVKAGGLEDVVLHS